MKADQERVKTLLTETVTLLCKNGLQFSEELKVQGLLGITLDNNDVFVVHINEIFNGLVGAQVSGVRPEETSAIAAADSATSDANLKMKKIPSQKFDTPSPVGSAKRKARTQTANLAVKVKKEVVDDDLVVIDSKCFDHGDFSTDDLSGDGDREAMRKSYGEMAQAQQTTTATATAAAAAAKWRVPDSASESFIDSQSQLSGAFGTCLVKGAGSKITAAECEETLGDSSLDGSQISGVGQLTSEGQMLYESTPGCSGWDSQGLVPAPVSTGETTSQDSIRMRRPVSGLPKTAGTDSIQPFRRPRYSFKPYECPEPGCGRKFYHRGDVYRHQRINHGANHVGRPHRGRAKRNQLPRLQPLELLPDPHHQQTPQLQAACFTEAGVVAYGIE